MSVHVCKCEHNGRVEYHIRYPGMTEHNAQNLADQINAGRYTAPQARTSQDVQQQPQLLTDEEIERLRKDAARYQWLRSEHERFDPLCHLTWKQNSDRLGRVWVNTINLDSTVDAAMESEK